MRIQSARLVRSPRRAAPGGFTIVELIITMTVILLLIGLVALVAPAAIHAQKASNTRQTMTGILLAIEQFATEDPLRGFYDKPGRESFGSYPPYQLANIQDDNAQQVARIIEPSPPSQANQYSLRLRIERDLRGQLDGSSPNPNWTNLSPQPGFDDIRGLDIYLSLYVPAAIAKVPDNIRKPVSAGAAGDMVSRSGKLNDTTPEAAKAKAQVLGFVDAWGVPFDYMLYTKLAWEAKADGSGMAWKVFDRRPVLRSLGLQREKFDAWNLPDGDTRNTPTVQEMRLDKSMWIFSEDLPQPWFGGGANPNAIAYDRMNPSAAGAGRIANNVQGAQYNGWLRAVAADERFGYGYRPDQD